MRKAVFGEPVTAEDVEALPADTGPTAFVRLCGALIGRALAERFGHSVVPQITERIVVPDQGVDAEYASPPIEGTPEASGLLGPGRTVFQIKYRDARSRGRKVALNSLHGQLRRDFARGGPACDRFVLMMNLHLAGAQPYKLRALLDGVPALAGKPIEIFDAARIAVRLNQSPHLRHLFFSAGGLCTLDVAEEELKAAYETLGWPPFVGRAQERAAIEEFVRAPGARVIQVVGPRYVGKTRLVIEALKPYGANVLWATQPDGVSLDHFRDLDTSDEATILVVDRCEPASMQRILDAAGSRRRLKTILVRDGMRSETGPGTLLVGPFGHGDTGTLIGSLLPKAPWREQSWIRETTGGVPGLIVHVAALLDEARISTTSPSEEIHRKLGELVEEKYLLPFDADARRALSIAALLPVLGVEGEPSKEADVVSRALGLAPEVFGAQLHELQSLGLVRTRGRFVEVTPPLLADRLAAQALREPERVLAELRLALVAIDRAHLQAVAEAVRPFGLQYRHAAGVDMLVDAREPRARSAVHMIFVREKVRPEYLESVPDFSTPVRTTEGVLLAPVADLVRMKLTSYRLKDRVHIQDLDAVALVTPEIEAQLSEPLRARLREVRSTE